MLLFFCFLVPLRFIVVVPFLVVLLVGVDYLCHKLMADDVPAVEVHHSNALYII